MIAQMVLSFRLTKQICVRPCIQHEQGQFSIILFPNQQPVRLYMAFPLPISVAMKCVRLETRGNFAVGHQFVYNLLSLSIGNPRFLHRLRSFSNCLVVNSLYAIRYPA